MNTAGRPRAQRRETRQLRLPVIAAIPPVAAVLVWLIVASMDHPPREVTTTDVIERDVRQLTPGEFAERVAAGDLTLNVDADPAQEIEGTDGAVPFDEIGAWPWLPERLSTPILVYSENGRVSGTAARGLRAWGYTKVAHLEGGTKAWVQSGRGLVRVPAGS